MIRIANYLVEFKRNKFRISLPSRRGSDDQTEQRDECELGIRSGQCIPIMIQCHPKNKPNQDQTEMEFVYFNEDLLPKLNDVLGVLLPERNGGVLDCNLMPIVNFRCMIYHNDTLCFNLLIRCDGHVINTTDASGKLVGSNALLTSNTHTRSSIAAQTKVTDRSIIYLFMETSNKTLLLTNSLTESDTTTNVDDDEVVVDMQLEEDHEEGETDRKQIRERKLATTQPNLDALPLTVSTFSISSESEDNDAGVGNDLDSDHINDCSLLSPEIEDLDWNLEKVVTVEDMPPRVSLEDENDREKLAESGNRSFELGSMSTIYSEESFEVVIDKDGNKLKDFDIYSTDDEQELLATPEQTRQPQTSQTGSSLQSLKSLKITERSRLSKSVNSEIVESSSTNNADPYENPESLQAQMTSLEEKDLIYTQTMEIVSDDEYDTERRRRERTTTNTDALGTLLDKLPLSDVKHAIKYIREHLLLSKEDISKRQQLVARMEQVLCDNGFNCHLYIFGSTKNSLGMRSSSDIDIFIQLKDSRGHPIDETHISYGKIEHVLHRIDRILGDDQSYLSVLTDTPNSTDLCIQTICHRHMRVPITRLKIYLDSKPLSSSNGTTTSVTVNSTSPDQVLQCDLNANNALGIANTRLIRFLCSFEPRFFVLNVLLRYWSKYVSHLNKPDALSSYALTNLLLFFCQMRKPQLLPPIDYFIKLSTQPKIVNDWRCDFEKDRSKLDFRTQNTESIMQLFVGFFGFYNTFNFTQFKISTRYGRSWRLRNNFNSGRRQLTGRQRTDRRETDRVPAMHIMDPFEQSHNLTARMRVQMFDKMCLEFNNAAKQYQKYL